MNTLHLIAMSAVLAGCASTAQQGAEAPVPAPAVATASEPVPAVNKEVPAQVVATATVAAVVPAVPAVTAPVQAAAPPAKAEVVEQKTSTGWEDLSRIIAAWMGPAQKAAADNCPQDARKP